MKTIKRDYYLNKLIQLKSTPDIKVITGVRRSGKTKLLRDYIEYIKSIEDSNIIFIDFNDIEFENLKSYKKLNTYIEKNYKDNKNNYVFIDEVQMCKKFELVVNSIHNSEKYDIYITGSNAFLLSSDLATLFTGRTMNVEVFPFSFKEYIDYFDLKDEVLYKSFDSYVKDGGMPGSYLYNDVENKSKYIISVFNTIIQRDLLEKYRIKDINLLNKISNYLMDNISNLTTPNNITKYLNSLKEDTTNKTVSNYINYLCNAFLFYDITRYDIKGKKHLETIEKYYLVDHSFRTSNLGTTKLDYGRVYENIVLIELLRRGYEVNIGVLYKTEIDFIAKKGNELLYIQVSSNIDNEETFNREITPLMKITNATKKILIARTYEESSYHDGIQIVDISKWLSE